MTLTTLSYGYFLAVIFLIYYIIPPKHRWIVLLCGNIYFYYDCGMRALLFLIGTIVVTYFMGLIIDKYKGKALVIWSCTLIMVALLCIMRTPFGSIIAPLGLSFYALQCMGYIIEVYRQTTNAERNIAKYALFVSYFPHVLQGPFADYNDLKNKLFAEHLFDYDKCVRGLYRIAWGVMKKLVIADRISYIIDGVYESPEGHYGFTVLYVMTLYAIQLYTDFSGYMDMAIGSSYLFGVDLQENFNVPYGSKSMAEFWRRWHMSLGLWFKNYVFYPVLRTKLCTDIRKRMKSKGNKYGMNVFPSVIALTVLWTLIGLWHGFDWNYLCYDWFCGLIIIASELLKPVYDRINGISPRLFSSKFMDSVRIIRTMFLVEFSFLFFRPDTLSGSITLMKNLFIKADIHNMCEFIYWNLYDEFLIALPLLLLVIVDAMKYKGIDVIKKLHSMNPIVRYTIYVLGLVLIYVAKGDRGGLGFAYYVF